MGWQETAYSMRLNCHADVYARVQRQLLSSSGNVRLPNYHDRDAQKQNGQIFGAAVTFG